MTSMADNTDGALTSAQMLQMQQQVQQWTIMVEIQSTITSSWRTRSSPWCRNRLKPTRRVRQRRRVARDRQSWSWISCGGIDGKAR